VIEDALAKAERAPEGPKKPKSIDFAQKRRDEFPAGIDVVVSVLEKAKLVGLCGDGEPDGIEEVPATVARSW
jgi:hypothetical protein